MTTVWALVGLVTMVATILLANRRPAWQRVFHWLPIPLWCYLLPMIAVTVGWLPRDHPTYHLVTNTLLPFALTLLLLGVDLPSVMQTGGQALMAAVIGAVGVIIGAPLGVLVLRRYLPPEAWKGAGALAGTWTGGTMNLLSLRSILNTPDTMFTPLIAVDAMIAYSWMALLVAASGAERTINRWLHAEARRANIARLAETPTTVCDSQPTQLSCLVRCGIVALGVVLSAHLLAAHLPISRLVSSTSGWTVLLVTTVALGLSLLSPMRRLGASGSTLGYPCLYLVLAATGAQASLAALWSSPAWIGVGLITVLVHGVLLLACGRVLRLPLGMLATASQANIGGVVSAPLVGAIYHQSLAPVGLLLAMAYNAVGTYLGWISAMVCRWLLHA